MLDTHSNSIRSFRQKHGSGIHRIALFFIGLVIVSLLALWTSSHNIPMMANGTVEMLRYFGALAALAGEFLLLVCYVLPFFTAGTQRTVTIVVGIVVFLILLFNSIVGYAQLAAHNPMVDRIVDFYGGFIAPFPIFISVFFGIMLIIETSPDIRQRNAEAAAKVQTQKRKTDMARWVEAQTDEMFENLDEVHNVLKAGAIMQVVAEAKALFKTQTGRDPTPDELEAAFAYLNQSKSHPQPFFPMPGMQPTMPGRTIPVQGGNGNGKNA